MSGYLRYQARQERPDVEELAKLANSVEEFTTCLIDPLKSDTKEREAFGDTLDLVIDKAIEYNQKKVTKTHWARNQCNGHKFVNEHKKHHVYDCG